MEVAASSSPFVGCRRLLEAALGGRDARARGLQRGQVDASSWPCAFFAGAGARAPLRDAETISPPWPRDRERASRPSPTRIDRKSDTSRRTRAGQRVRAHRCALCEEARVRREFAPRSSAPWASALRIRCALETHLGKGALRCSCQSPRWACGLEAVLQKDGRSAPCCSDIVPAFTRTWGCRAHGRVVA